MISRLSKIEVKKKKVRKKQKWHQNNKNGERKK
jgi:hypothetical protein